MARHFVEEGCCFIVTFAMILLTGYGCSTAPSEPEIQIKGTNLIEITRGKTSLPLKVTSAVFLENGNTAGDFRVNISQISEGALKIVPEFTPAHSESVKVKGLTLWLTPLRNVRVEAMYHEGFQSWSPAYVWKGEVFQPFLRINISSGEIPSDIQLPYLSWWLGGWEGNGISVIAGALKSHIFKTRVVLSKSGELLIIQGQGPGEVKEVKAGETLYFDPLVFISRSDVETSLKLYGEILSSVEERLTPPYTPLGWNSWNTFFENITAGTILQQSEYVKRLFPRWAEPVIQIDDGWEIAWGVWKAKDEFLGSYSSFEEFVSRITENGLRAGIWTAPFLYSASLTLPRENPEMFVRDENGNPVLYHHPSGETFTVVDPTSPQGAEFLRNTFSTLRKAGFTYFKIDFLFAPLMGSTFYDGSTPVEAYRRGLKIIKEAAGPDSYILACGAPLLPTAGLAHGIRLGFDIAVENIPYGWHMVKNEFRNVFWRFFWNRIFDGDPDTVLLRGLSRNEAEIFLIASLFSGKIFALGDDLSALEPQKLQLIENFLSLSVFETLFTSRDSTDTLLVKSLLPPSPNAPADIITQSFFPSLYRVPEVIFRKISETSALLGVFNWENFEIRVRLDISEMIGCRSSCALKNIFTGEELQTPGIFEKTLPPHTAQLWMVKNADTPQTDM